MKQNVWMSAAILCATSACATAGVGQSGNKTPKTITVTGCVQNDGAKGSATMDGGYMLTNTVTGNASGFRRSSPGSAGPPDRDDVVLAAGAGSSGTAAPAPAAPTANADAETSHRSASYMLNGRDNELRNYIDHKVEVTGTLEDHVDEPGDVNSTPTRGSQMTHGRNTGLQWLHVASVKLISSGCSAK